MDYSQSAIPKGQTRAEAKRLRDRLKARIDRLENAKVRKRSEGRCEVVVIGEGRCHRRATEVHHLISGNGKRAVGPSLLMEHKQHVCAGIGGCHPKITEHKLKLIQFDSLPMWNDRYLRA
jgi:hypothetical protein